MRRSRGRSRKRPTTRTKALPPGKTRSPGREHAGAPRLPGWSQSRSRPAWRRARLHRQNRASAARSADRGAGAPAAHGNGFRRRRHPPLPGGSRGAWQRAAAGAGSRGRLLVVFERPPERGDPGAVAALRLELFGPVGGPRWTLVAQPGRVRAVVPAERATCREGADIRQFIEPLLGVPVGARAGCGPRRRYGSSDPRRSLGPTGPARTIRNSGGRRADLVGKRRGRRHAGPAGDGRRL